MARFEDELDDVTPNTKTAATATNAATATAKASAKDELEEDEAPAPKATTKSKANAAPADDDENLDVSFGDQKLMAKGDGLNRIRAEKGKMVRFALLPFVNPKAAKSHFVETKDKKGTFRCLPVKEGEIPYCCQKLDEEGQQHVVALAIHYTNASPKDGGYEKGTPIEYEIGYVDLSRSNYRAVSNLIPEDGTIFDIDIAMAKKDNGIGYEFVARSTKAARWKLNPELAAEVEAAAQKFVKDGGKKLAGKLGRKLTLIEWKALLAGQSNAKEASMEDIEDM
jgi:hypothetical protein